MLSQARSRSKGPLSDQVADAPYPRGQCRSWVEPCGSIAVPGTAGIGASFPFPRVPAKVPSHPICRPSSSCRPTVEFTTYALARRLHRNVVSSTTIFDKDRRQPKNCRQPSGVGTKC
jgi:hypothetical protein